MADDITHYDAIEGYVHPTSILQGEPALVRISTAADRFDVAVHRWGGERELVWSATGLTGTEQSTPPDADSAGCGAVLAPR